jgi:acyl phosphate:glycerol-3-phosphate acyltransferase
MFPSLDWSLVPAFVAALAFGYLLGSIPFGIVLTKLGGTADIRAIGSGNIGATNVLRTGRKGLAVATLLGDALKGTLAVLIAALYGPDLALAAALGAFLGHLYPVWLKFHGGKGVATYIGILLALAWPVGLAFCLVWIAVAALTRYSSLSGLLASAVSPVALWMLGDHPGALVMALLTVLLWIKHRANLVRLVNGSEGKIGAT